MSEPAAAPPGLGIDLVSVARFRDSVESGGQAFLDRIFTGNEQQDCLSRKEPHPSLAARFAAKEAVMKALGTGWGAGVRFQDIECCFDGRVVQLARQFRLRHGALAGGLVAVVFACDSLDDYLHLLRTVERNEYPVCGVSCYLSLDFVLVGQ